MTGEAEQPRELTAKSNRGTIRCFHRRKHVADFLRLSQQMRETTLPPIHLDRVVGSIGIGDQQSVDENLGGQSLNFEFSLG
jgi:hypothetical protein